MSTITLKGKSYVRNHRGYSLFREIARAYRENQAEIICGILRWCEGCAGSRENIHDAGEADSMENEKNWQRRR